MENTPLFSMRLSRAEVRDGVKTVDGMVRANLTPRGLAGVPAMLVLMMGLEEVPAFVGRAMDAAERAMASTELVTLSVHVGALELARVEVA